MIFETAKDFANQLVTNGRLLGIDLGQARIGLATCDATRQIATPHSVYTRRNMSQDLGHLNNLCVIEKISGIVIGFPLELNGSEGKNCQQTRHFAKKLYKKTALPICLVDERLSTAAVTRAMQESNMTRKKRQSKDDKLAAAYILQGLLDSLSSTL